MPTIRDVARKLNISITTVSRALDGYFDVSEETRQLVVRTAREMGYSPNRAARQLRKRKAETIGFIIPASSQRFDEPLFMEFIAGLGNALSGNSYDLLVANATTPEQERETYEKWVNSHKVDGFVLNRMNRVDWRVRYLTEARFPFVSMGHSMDGFENPCIRVDGRGGYDALVQHLLEKGFTRFAFLGGLDELTMHRDRLEWFRTSLAQRGIELRPEHIRPTDLSSNGGYTAARPLLEMTDRPTALVCVNDEVAYGAIHAAHDQKLVIGKEIAIAGFDGLRDSQHTEPALTTLDIPIPEIASRLAHMLLAILDGQALPEREIVIPARLVTRASTNG